MIRFLEAKARFDQFIDQNMGMLNAPAITAAFTDKQGILAVSAHGYADAAARVAVKPEMLFQIGSISKSFAAVVLLQLREEGVIDLQQPVSRYLRWFEIPSEYEPITIHHLLSHTGGISSGTERSPSALAEVWAMRRMATSTAPGSYFHYSNDGYKVLGLLLEAVLGEDISTIYRERIFEPLGMKEAEPVITHDVRRRMAIGYQPYYDDRPLPQGGMLAPATWFEGDSADGAICANVLDMAAYLRMLMNQGAGPRGPVISPESFGLMTQPIIQPDDGYHGEFYGYGLNSGEREGHRHIWHGGGMVGYTSTMEADMEDGLGVIVLCSGPASPEVLGRYGLSLMRAALHQQELPALPPPMDPFRVEDGALYAGSYRGANGSIQIAAEGERLFFTANDDQQMPLEKREDGSFYTLHPDFDLFPLRFNQEKQELTHGPDWYLRDGVSAPDETGYPQEWEGYLGHYCSHNPWLNNFRVIVRQGKLLLVFPAGDESVLIPLAEGVFRVGKDDRSPERIRFEQLIDGKAVQANLSGGSYYRTFTR